MKIVNGTEYANVFERAASFYIAFCAEKPQGAKRAAAHGFITGIYQNIYADPTAFGFKPAPDVHFKQWEPQKGREGDVKIIRDAIAKIDALMEALYALSLSAEAREDGLFAQDGKSVKRSLLKQLAAAGAEAEKQGDGLLIRLPKGCAEGLCELANISKAFPLAGCEHIAFRSAAFEPKSPWLVKGYDEMLKADGKLIWLCGELEKRGYELSYTRDKRKQDLSYVKLHGKKDAEVKWAWAERAHTGIELTYEDIHLEPAYIWLRVPLYQNLLERMDEMPERPREFLLAHTKSCDGCRFCVQTDKTGTRPLAAIKAGGKMKCPRFPAFGMNWRELTKELAENILAALDAMDAMMK